MNRNDNHIYIVRKHKAKLDRVYKKQEHQANEIENRLSERQHLVDLVYQSVKRYPIEDGHKMCIAATEVFVEKAQEALTQKSDKFFKYGIWVSGYITVLLTAVGLLLIFDQNMRHFENQLDFWAVVLRKLAGGGFIAGLSIYLIYNARALFAEATVYTHQRHALRFGRLIAYVKNMQKMSVNEIIKMFKWSENFSNYFKDIKPESSGKTTQTYLTDSIKHVSNGLSRWKAAGTNT